MTGRRRGAVALIVICLALHVFIVVSIVSHSRPIIWPLHNDTIHRQGPAADFFAVYHASVNLSEGRSPYGFEDDGRTPYFFPYRYMPVVAHAGRLMLGMSPFAAYRLWVALLEFLLVALIVFLWRAMNGWRRVFAVCCLLLSSPYFLELYMGQFTFATVSLMAIGLITSCCVFYVIAVLLKMFPLAAGVSLIRTRRWKCFAVAVAVLLLMTVPDFAGNVDDFKAFRALNLNVPDGVAGGTHGGNYGFAYLLYLLMRAAGLSPNWPAFTGAFHLLALAVTAVAVFLSRERRLLVGACAMVLAHFMGYAQVWEHHYSGVVILGILLLSEGRNGGWLVPVTAGSLVLLALPTPFALFDLSKDPSVWDPSAGWPLYASLAVLLPKALPLAALYAVSMAALLRAGFLSPRTALRLISRGSEPQEMA